MDNFEEYLLYKHLQVLELIDYLYENCEYFDFKTELSIMEKSIAAIEKLPKQKKKKLIALIKEEGKALDK